MSINIETCRISYDGTGTVGPFAYTWKIYNASDLEVLKTDSNGAETLLILNVDYSITGVGVATGGNVTLTEILPVGYTLNLRRDMPYLQEQAWANLQEFTATSINDALDKLEMQIQQLREVADRTFQVPRDVTLTNELYLRPLAGYLIGWDAAGTNLYNYPTTTLSVPSIDHIGNHSDNLATAVTDIGTTKQLLLINKAIVLNENTVVPDTLYPWTPEGGEITLGSYNLTINGMFDGGFGCFHVTGTGRVYFALLSGTVKGSQWFGMVGDYDGSTGGTDNTTAFSAALTSVPASGKCELTPGNYKLVSQPVAMTKSMTLEGTNSDKFGGGARLAFPSTSGLRVNYEYSALKNLTVDGRATYATGLDWDAETVGRYGIGVGTAITAPATSARNCRISNVQAIEFDTGIYYGGVYAGPYQFLENSEIWANQCGVASYNVATWAWARGCNFTSNTKHGFYGYASFWDMQHCLFESNGNQDGNFLDPTNRLLNGFHVVNGGIYNLRDCWLRDAVFAGAGCRLNVRDPIWETNFRLWGDGAISMEMENTAAIGTTAITGWTASGCSVSDNTYDYRIQASSATSCSVYEDITAYNHKLGNNDILGYMWIVDVKADGGAQDGHLYVKPYCTVMQSSGRSDSTADGYWFDEEYYRIKWGDTNWHRITYFAFLRYGASYLDVTLNNLSYIRKGIIFANADGFNVRALDAKVRNAQLILFTNKRIA